MIQIQETTRYSQFKTIRGNREINKVHLKHLVDAIAENNLLPANPIIVNEEYQILDGQHRLMACEKLGIPVYFVIVKTGSLKEIQMLNSNIRNWNMNDFLNSYCARGAEEYLKIKKFMDKTDLSLSISLYLLNGSADRKGNHKDLIESFKDGTFKTTFLEYAETMAKRIKELSSFAENDANYDRDFIAALAKVYRAGISHSTLINKLTMSKMKIQRFPTRRQYVRLLEDVLSYKTKEAVRLT